MSPLSVLGISGFKGAGKTTLIEQLLVKLNMEGLQVAVIKHHHENVTNDRPGTDTYRFYWKASNAAIYLRFGCCDREKQNLHYQLAIS